MPSCPACRKKLSRPEFAPFCSAHCQKVDLGRWFSESYSVPAVETDEFSELSGDEPDAPSPEKER